MLENEHPEVIEGMQWLITLYVLYYGEIYEYDSTDHDGDASNE